MAWVHDGGKNRQDRHKDGGATCSFYEKADRPAAEEEPAAYHCAAAAEARIGLDGSRLCWTTIAKWPKMEKKFI